MKKPNYFQFLSGKRILITGGRGFIGSTLAEYIASKNTVTLFDNGRRDALRFIDAEKKRHLNIVSGDIQNSDDVARVVRSQDIIFHLAAIAGASSYQKDPYRTISVNLLGTQNLLKNLIGTSSSHVILFSSSEVYGPDAHNVSEDDPTTIGTVYDPRWSYAISKLASDHLAFAYYTKYQLPIAIVRPFNIYGPGQVGEGAVSDMIQSALGEGIITVDGNGKQKRSWCYVTDLIAALEQIVLKHVTGECYNIGNHKSYSSIRSLAEKIQKLTGASIRHRPNSKTDIRDRLPNIHKAEKELNFHPAVTLDQGLKKSIAWYTKHLNEIS